MSTVDTISSWQKGTNLTLTALLASSLLDLILLAAVKVNSHVDLDN